LSKDDAIKLTIKSLLEVVQTGAKNIEITYVDGFNQIKVGYTLLILWQAATLIGKPFLRTWKTKRWKE
jgi:hypothetical protein